MQDLDCFKCPNIEFTKKELSTIIETLKSFCIKCDYTFSMKTKGPLIRANVNSKREEFGAPIESIDIDILKSASGMCRVSFNPIHVSCGSYVPPAYLSKELPSLYDRQQERLNFIKREFFKELDNHINIKIV